MKTSLGHWQSVWRELDASSVNEELYHQLVACYSEPHRKYHTIQHLNECLTHLESARALADHADEVELALWFHDAIYDTSKKDNEQRSGAWARDSVLAAGLSSEKADRIYELIMATMHKAVPLGPETDTRLGRVRISPVHLFAFALIKNSSHPSLVPPQNPETAFEHRNIG